MSGGQPRDLVRELFLDDSTDDRFEVRERHDDVATIDYNNDTIIANLKGFNKLSPVDQLAHVSRLSVFIERLKDQGLELLPPVFKYVAQGRVDLIQACLSQVQTLAEYLKNNLGPAGYKTLISVITPFLTELVDHEEPDIRDMARSKLGDIAELMTEADRSNYVLKVCLELVQEQQRDQNKIAGLKLLGQLASLFQKEFVQGFVVIQLIALSQDPNDNVRVVTVEQMAQVSDMLDKDVVLKKFAPQFKSLSQDPNWQVRLKFVEKSVTLAEHIPLEKRNQVFGDIFMNLLNDKTRWVKEAALQQLGSFLALLDAKNKNDKLFEEYLKIPKVIAKLNKEPQNKICFAVAESLPKIIAAQGESTWKSLSGPYKLLLKQDEEVQIMLAKNIHLLSKSLTRPENKNELLSVMKQNFLSNKASEKLRQEALKNLASFLEMLDQDKREELADIYSQMQQGNRKWRIRQIIASQISLLSRLFLEETIQTIIIPISFQLCKDEVANVRETACEQIEFLLKNNIDRVICKLVIVEQIKSFATYNRFTFRQAFIYMCDGLMNDMELFRANFMPLFVNLVQDKVINVRITLAKILVKHFDRKSEASKDAQINKMYKDLMQDKSQDIVKILKKEHTIIDDVISSSSSDHNASHSQSEDKEGDSVHVGNILEAVGDQSKTPPAEEEDMEVVVQAPIQTQAVDKTVEPIIHQEEQTQVKPEEIAKEIPKDESSVVEEKKEEQKPAKNISEPITNAENPVQEISQNINEESTQPIELPDVEQNETKSEKVEEPKNEQIEPIEKKSGEDDFEI